MLEEQYEIKFYNSVLDWLGWRLEYMFIKFWCQAGHVSPWHLGNLYGTVNEFHIYIVITIHPHDFSSLGGFLIGEKSRLYLGFGYTNL